MTPAISEEPNVEPSCTEKEGFLSGEATGASGALGEYNGLKQELPKLEDEWLELSTQIEEETARELS